MRFACVLAWGMSLMVTFVEGMARDWPAFRGPNGNGRAIDEKPPLEWDREKNVRWRIALPGTGNGSPIVVKGRVLLTCAKNNGRQRTLHCFDRATGKESWKRTVDVEAIELTHKTNPYCGTTPVSDGNVVVVWHATGGLHCYSLDGEPRWSRDFGEVRHIWGYGTSPILYRDRVILHSGASPNIFVAAVRLSDGELLWKTDEPGGVSNESPGVFTGSWCTPAVMRVAGKDQIVCGMPTRVVAYDPDDGRVIWSCAGLSADQGKVVYTSPLIGDEVVVVLGGYQGPAVAVRAGGSGDVTETHRLWRVTRRNPQRIGSGVVVDDSIYIANADSGTVQCIDLNTGEERWRERLRGGAHWASTLLADGYLFATNQRGTTHVFRPNPSRLELVATNSLDELINATPAISDGELFIRTEKHLYCISRSK